jgi:hypothetical protein
MWYFCISITTQMNELLSSTRPRVTFTPFYTFQNASFYKDKNYLPVCSRKKKTPVYASVIIERMKSLSVLTRLIYGRTRMSWNEKKISAFTSSLEKKSYTDASSLDTVTSVTTRCPRSIYTPKQYGWFSHLPSFTYWRSAMTSCLIHRILSFTYNENVFEISWKPKDFFKCIIWCNWLLFELFFFPFYRYCPLFVHLYFSSFFSLLVL